MGDLDDLANKLNRLYRLYAMAIGSARPYRVHKIRQAYLEAFNSASLKYQVILLDSIAEYEMLLGPLPGLPALTKRKEAAIESNDYEEAAAIRDQEKEYIRNMIQQSGKNKDDHFFADVDRIFYKKW